MRRKIIQSSNIRSIGFESNVLEIEFNTGLVYQYYPVSEYQYHEMMNAKSKGQYFLRYIRNNISIQQKRII